MLRPTLFLAAVLLLRDAMATTYEEYEEVEDYNDATNRHYGYAMYGFWGGIVLVGTLYRIWLLWRARRSMRRTSDSEGQGMITGSGPVRAVGHSAHANLIIPTTLGTHHSRLLYWCTIPTRMEMMVIVAYWILTLVLVAVGYRYIDYDDTDSEISTSITSQKWSDFADRAGVIAVSNIPIIWLFSGRNNILLWFTGWSFQTFNLFHRHIARVTILLAIGHAAAETHQALTNLEDGVTLYASDLQEAWFVWGIAATVAFGAFWIFSFSWFRQKCYELFLIVHIGLAIVVLYGIFEHTTQEDGAFNNYLWVAVAFWCFDRLLRIIRLVACNLHVRYNGTPFHTASTMATYDEKSDVIHVHIETAGLGLFRPVPGQHCFIYQPGSLKFWESHPFTIGAWNTIVPIPASDDHPGQLTRLSGSDPSIKLSSDDSGSPTPTVKSDGEKSDAERSDSEKSIVLDNLARTRSSRKNSTDETILVPAHTKTLCFWIRPYDGWTKRLRDQCKKSPTGVIQPRLLMEGPYGSSKHIHSFDTVLLLAGGTGISSIIPYIKDHMSRSIKGETRVTQMRLVWLTRHADFVKTLYEQELCFAVGRPDFEMDVYLTSGGATTQDGSSEPKENTLVPGDRREIRYHAGRPDVKTLVDGMANEMGGGDKCAVFVCGPPGLADGTRRAVYEAMKRGHRGLQYFEDSFGW